MGSSNTWNEEATTVNVNAYNHYGKLHTHSGSSEDEVLPVNKCIPIVTARKAPEQTSPRRRVAIIGCLCVLLVALVVCAAIVVPITMKNSNKNSDPNSLPEMINTVCNTTLYPQVCEETLRSEDDGTEVTGSKDLIHKSVKSASYRVSEMKTNATSLSSGETDVNVLAALNDCGELLDDALEMLNETMRQITSLNLSSMPEMDTATLVTFMSAALTDHTTCIDGVADLSANATAKESLSKLGTSVDQVLSNALSLVNSFTEFGDDLSKWRQLLRERSLLERRDEQAKDDGFPNWMGVNTRRQLTNSLYKVNVVVARDGSGMYKEIQEAIDEAPERSGALYVIYVKKGIYSGQFQVPESKTNLMLLGDGIGQTILTGGRNVQMEGVTTFLSATLIIEGAGFIGKGFTVRNTAGPQKQQAVAIRVSADRVAFWQCSFEAYQDTLYAHTCRQFYYQCTVEGTVDFIFGNGAALFQSCNLRPKVPLPKQQNTITAQGRTDPSQNTGFIFHDCSLDGGRDLQRSIRLYPTYLGRPWKEYSRTVFIGSYLGKVINPAGWLIWSGDWALRTCYYAEYQSRGPGSTNTKQRVWWSKQIQSANEVIKYSTDQFLGGNYWLPATKVPYNSTIYT